MARQLLEKTTVGELVQDKKLLVYVDQTATIGQATELMRQNNILALPVYDTVSKKFLGIVDTFNIMFYLAFGKFKVNVKNPAEVVFDAKAEYAKQPFADLVGASSESSLCWTFDASDSLSKVLEPFSKGIHRAVVLSGNQDPRTARIISQYDVIQFLQRNSPVFAPLMHKSLNDANLATPAGGSVVSITEVQTALDGFRRMFVQGVGAVGVVSVIDGHLVANLSASDVRGISADNVRDVQRPVMGFLTAQYTKPFKPVTATPADPVESVVLKVVTAHVHRVWVVDSAFKPLGVVSLSDIITAVAKL